MDLKAMFDPKTRTANIIASASAKPESEWSWQERAIMRAQGSKVQDAPMQQMQEAKPEVAEAPQAPRRVETRMEIYKSPKDMANGVNKMSKQGWRVVTQSSFTPKKGAARMLAGGFVFLNRKPEFTVTFERG